MTRDGADRRKRSPGGDQTALFDDDMAAFRAALGTDFTVADAVAALSRCGSDTDSAIRSLLDAAADEKGRAGRDVPMRGRRTSGVEAGRGFGGAAPLPPHPVKTEPVEREPIDSGFDEVKVNVKFEAPSEVEVNVKAEVPGEVGIKVKRGPIEADGPFQGQAGQRVMQEEEADEIDVKEEEEVDEVDVEEEVDEVDVKEEEADEVNVKEEEKSGVSEDEVEIIEPPPRPKKKLRREDDGADFIDLTTSHPVPYLSARPIRAVPPPGAVPANEWRMVVAPLPAELDQRPPDGRDWCLFKKSYAIGLSTCRGRKLLDSGEVVHFAFPSYDWLYGRARVSARQAAALAEIVRFSTNRSGEIGKLSPVWAKCLAPLVSSSKVMIQGKMVFPMVELRLMQEVLLYVSFYINRSCLYLIDPENARRPDNPLRSLFKLLRRFGES